MGHMAQKADKRSAYRISYGNMMTCDNLEAVRVDAKWNWIGHITERSRRNIEKCIRLGSSGI
jgi:hypothetical protein